MLTSEDGLLDFHTGVGYHTWAPEEHTWASQKINTGIAFPSDHPNPLSIKKLNLHNCKISAISSEISVFANLEEIDATHNVITSLHPSMAKLTKLRKLNLMGNKITEFPQVLFKMPWLREVDFRVPPNYYNGRPALIVPAEFVVACPECVVLV